MENNKLSLFEASSIIAGLGIGGGIMAVPYLASLNGLVPILLVFACAYGLSLLLHLMITEMIMRDKQTLQLVETFSLYLFKSKLGGIFTWLLFVLVVLNFYALLAAFLIGAGQIITNVSPMPSWCAQLIVYIFAAGPILFGLKALGVSEKIGIAGIIALVVIFVIGAMTVPFNSLNLISFSSKGTLALYGMIMFTLSCFFSIPQVAKGLSHNKKLIPKAVILGISINLLLVSLITVITLLVSADVTEMAMIGLGNAIGQWAVYLGTVFVFLAILTSYWATSYALAIVIEERLNWSYKLCWLCATTPTLLLALSGISGFLGFMRIAGGLLAVIISLMVIPAYRASRLKGQIENPEFELKKLSHPLFQGVIVAAYVLVVIGSSITID